MSRDDGFSIADLDTGFLDDAKVRALVRATRDEAIVARAIVAYIAAFTSSWANAERVSVADAAPLWLTDVEDLVARLAAAGLLEADGRIVEHAWGSWFAKAKARRDAARDRWARYNARRQAAIDGGDRVTIDDDATTSPPRGADLLPRGSEPDQRGNHVSRARAVPPGPSSPSGLNGSVEGARRANGEPQRGRKKDGSDGPVHVGAILPAALGVDNLGRQHNAAMTTDCPGCGQAISGNDGNVRVDRSGMAVEHVSCGGPVGAS